jgi:hypothetical protein
VCRNKLLYGSFAKLHKWLLSSSCLSAWNNTAFLRYTLLAYKFLCKIQYRWGLMSSGIWRCLAGYFFPDCSQDLTIFILTFRQTMKMILWRVGNSSTNDTASHCRRFESSVRPLWEPKISQRLWMFSSKTRDFIDLMKRNGHIPVTDCGNEVLANYCCSYVRKMTAYNPLYSILVFYIHVTVHRDKFPYKKIN